MKLRFRKRGFLNSLVSRPIVGVSTLRTALIMIINIPQMLPSDM